MTQLFPVEGAVDSHAPEKSRTVDSWGGDNVIKLVDCWLKEMDFGGTKIRMPPCLRLSPRGVSPYNLTAKYLRKKTTMIAEGMKLGLGYIHSHGIVDNDLSFQNFIIFDERAVIVDLGSAEPEYIFQYG